jgi:hypothetical protein
VQLAEDEEALSTMVGVQEMLEDGDSEEFQKALEELELSNSIELGKAIRNLRSKIKKTKAKILAAANVNSEEIPKVAPQNEVRTQITGHIFCNIDKFAGESVQAAARLSHSHQLGRDGPLDCGAKAKTASDFEQTERSTAEKTGHGQAPNSCCSRADANHQPAGQEGQKR